MGIIAIVKWLDHCLRDAVNDLWSVFPVPFTNVKDDLCDIKNVTKNNYSVFVSTVDQNVCVCVIFKASLYASFMHKGGNPQCADLMFHRFYLSYLPDSFWIADHSETEIMANLLTFCQLSVFWKLLDSARIFFVNKLC